jgi:hypothetical protein
MRYQVGLAALAAGVLSIATASCGQAESESAQVESVAHRYYAALGSGNGSELCSLLTDEAKQRLIRSGAVLIAHRSKTPSCPDVVTAVHQIIGSHQLAEQGKVKVSLHSLSGNNASVRVTEPSGRSTLVTMTKTPAGWLIELGIGVPRTSGTG